MEIFCGRWCRCSLNNRNNTPAARINASRRRGKDSSRARARWVRREVECWRVGLNITQTVRELLQYGTQHTHTHTHTLKYTTHTSASGPHQLRHLQMCLASQAMCPGGGGEGPVAVPNYRVDAAAGRLFSGSGTLYHHLTLLSLFLRLRSLAYLGCTCMSSLSQHWSSWLVFVNHPRPS